MSPYDTVSGDEGTAIERWLNRYTSKFIHLFLSVLAVIVMVSAVIAVVLAVTRDFPHLIYADSSYQALHFLLQDILLIAIAGELGLLLLLHRTSAAVEVVMFVIARRMVATDVTALDLLVGSVALCALLVVRYYYLPGKPQ